MANTLLTIDMITREALRILENQLTFTKFVNRDYDDMYAISGAKIGDTLRIRKPARYTVRSGATLSTQDVVETNATLVLDKQKGVDLTFTSKELTLSIDDFSERIIAPAIAALANQIDADGMAQYVNVYNAVGTPGTTPNAMLTFLQAGEKMANEAAPQDAARSVVVNPAAQVAMVDALKGLFHSNTELEQQYKDGTMGRMGGFKWSMDQNVAVHTVGPLGGTPLVNGASQTGASLITDGWSASAASRLKRGDVFTIALVYAVNPQTRASTGQLRQFVVTADVSSDGSGNLTAAISPSITTSGAFQTVNVGPADNAAITVLGAASTVSPQNMAFHRDAFTVGFADLVMPGGVDMASRVSSKQLGISMRMVRAYDINNDAFPTRLDVLYGWATIRPELAVRIAG